MTAPFNWAGLWAEACEAYDTVDAKRAICAERDEAAAAYIRTRIDAAFVPRDVHDRIVENTMGHAVNEHARAEAAEARVEVLEEEYHQLERLHAENCEAYDRACAEREWLRDRVNPEATARAEAAEACVKVLEEALIRLRDCDWVITLPDRMDAVRDVARQALGGEHA